MIVVIRPQDAPRIALGVVILPRPQRPQKRQKPEQPKPQRHRDQKDKNLHHFNRMAFSVTVIDDSDIAAAAISGVATPTSAKGTATML